MFDRQSIHIALLLWGAIFSVIAAFCMFMSKNFDKERRGWLLAIQTACALLLFNDALAWAYRGVAGMTGYMMVRLSNFLVFFISDVIMLLFHGYVCSCLFEKENTKKMAKKIKRINIVFLLATIGMALVVISQFTGLYYGFDAHNFYHRNAGHFISLLIPMAGMVLDLSLMIQYRKNISRQILISMISYIALPFAGAVVQMFYYGISLINIGISISMILMFVVAMVEQNQKIAMGEKEAADLRIAMMISQIAPHFIYNTLTSIQEMCNSDPKLAEETVGEFAQYLRGNLESLNIKDCVPFERELEHVRCYAAIEKKRFGDRVHVDYDIQDDEFLIPSLTLQVLVENAIKHGICKKRGGGTVWIHTERRNENIYITVRDDGAGFDIDKVKEDKRNHVGLSNVKNRIQNMCNGTLEIESKPGEGTTAIVCLPQK